MWGRGWAQAQGGWGPQEERQVLLLSSWLQLKLVGCCPHGAVGTGSSQCRVSCPSALGDATSSDLPWKAADPFPAKPQTLQPVQSPFCLHTTPDSSFWSSPPCVDPTPGKPSSVPLSPSPPLPNPMNSSHPQEPILQAGGLMGTLWAPGWTTEEMRKCLLRQGATPASSCVPAQRAAWSPGSCSHIHRTAGLASLPPALRAHHCSAVLSHLHWQHPPGQPTPGSNSWNLRVLDLGAARPGQSRPWQDWRKPGMQQVGPRGATRTWPLEALVLPSLSLLACLGEKRPSSAELTVFELLPERCFVF